MRPVAASTRTGTPPMTVSLKVRLPSMVTKSPIVMVRSETERLKMVAPAGEGGELEGDVWPPTATTVSMASTVALEGTSC